MLAGLGSRVKADRPTHEEMRPSLPSTILHVPLIIPMLPDHRLIKKRGSDRVFWAHQSLTIEVATRLWHSTAVLECDFSADYLLKFSL